MNALMNKKIARAGLGAFSFEALPEDNSLFNMNNGILTPHSTANAQGALINLGTHDGGGINQFLQSRISKNIVIGEVVSKGCSKEEVGNFCIGRLRSASLERKN